MFTRYSIRQLMLATAVVAVVFSIVAVGIQGKNLMGWGAVVSVALLPVLFLIYGVAVMLANMFCRFGNSCLGPLETAPSSLAHSAVASQPSLKPHEPSGSNPSITEAADEA